MSNIEEIWKTIDGYEHYQVSNLGRVKSLPKPYFTGKSYIRHGRIMIQRKKSNGYMQLSLYKNGKPKTFIVHRLVALAFIPNPYNLPYVNHIDENKDNNMVCNLEWCNASQNIHHGSALIKLSKAKLNHPSMSKPVMQLSLSGDILFSYPSANEAQRQTKIDQHQISKCCNNNKGYYTAGGFKWRYAV